MIDQISVTIKNTKRQWILLIILCIVTLLGSMIYSIQSPFYPAEAESKMATPSEYGFVLGTFGLIQFLLGPTFGIYVPKVGVKNAFHGGIVVAAISVIAFGFLNSIENRYVFVFLSFLLRMLEASGALAMSVATYIFVSTEFPGSIGKTFATIETVYGFGMSFGPSVGVVLFNIGGFTLPFVVLGITQFLAGGSAYVVLPKSTELEQVPSIHRNIIGNKKTLGFIALLKVPPVTMYFCAIVFAINTSQFIIGTILEPDLRQFNLSSTMFSTMFLLQGLTQAFFAIIWGYICDRIQRQEFITLIGSILLTIGSFSIGPFAYLPMEPNVAMTALSLIVIGVGTSAILVSSFLVSLREATNYGFPVNETTSGLLSGLLMSSISFGSFSGSLFAGILYQHFGFRVATSILSLLNFIFTILLALFICMKKPLQNKHNIEDLCKQDEQTPLLSNLEQPSTSRARNPNEPIGIDYVSVPSNWIRPMSLNDSEELLRVPGTNYESVLIGLTKTEKEPIISTEVADKKETDDIELIGTEEKVIEKETKESEKNVQPKKKGKNKRSYKKYQPIQTPK